MLEDEGHNKVNDHRGTYCKKGKVNEIHSDGGCPDAKLFAEPAANAKRLLLKP